MELRYSMRKQAWGQTAEFQVGIRDKCRKSHKVAEDQKAESYTTMVHLSAYKSPDY